MRPTKKPPKAGSGRTKSRGTTQVKTAKKTTDRKKAKPPARKEPQKAPRARPAKPEPAPEAAAPRPERVAPRRKAPPRTPSSPAAEILPRRKPIVAAVFGSALGAKWECFSCGAKFYDLGKQPPTCPKCGANQHERPRAEPRARHVEEPPPPPRPERPIPIIEEDDEERELVMDEDGLEIGIGPVDEEDFVGEEDDVEEEEEEEGEG